MSAVTHHPRGVQVKTVGNLEINCKHSCKEHRCCGTIIMIGTVMRLKKCIVVAIMLWHVLCLSSVSILGIYTTTSNLSSDENIKETAVAGAYWVTNGMTNDIFQDIVSVKPLPLSAIWFSLWPSWQTLISLHINNIHVTTMAPALQQLQAPINLKL